MSAKSHTLTGVWVEIAHVLIDSETGAVTPSRVCELKLVRNEHGYWDIRHTLTGVWVEIVRVNAPLSPRPSHPHGCVSWNRYYG